MERQLIYLTPHDDRREWTMERIAEALDVSKGTISKDLAGVVSNGNNPSRPKGGRPKGSGKPRRKRETPVLDRAREERRMQATRQVLASVAPSDLNDPLDDLWRAG